jgi:hypothetical protein
LMVRTFAAIPSTVTGQNSTAYRRDSTPSTRIVAIGALENVRVGFHARGAHGFHRSQLLRHPAPILWMHIRH